MKLAKKDVKSDASYTLAVRDLSAENHMRIVSSYDYSLFEGKRKIVIFPGGKTQSLKMGNGMCKLAERAFFSDAFIDTNESKLLIQERLKTNKAQHRAQKIRDEYEVCVMVYHNKNKALQAQQFFDDYIVPAVATINANGDLQKRAAETSAANLRHFVFDTHCYGGFVVKTIDEELKKLLPQLGYSAPESAMIARQCVVFDHNNIDETLGKTVPVMSYIRRMNLQDEVLEYASCYPGTYQRFIKGEKYKFEQPCLDVLSARELVLLTPDLCINASEAHNGYWHPLQQLTTNGQKERDIFNLMATEIVATSDKIENMADILTQIAAKRGKEMQILSKSIADGKQHITDFARYQCQVAFVAQMSANRRDFR